MGVLWNLVQARGVSMPHNQESWIVFLSAWPCNEVLLIRNRFLFQFLFIWFTFQDKWLETTKESDDASLGIRIDTALSSDKLFSFHLHERVIYPKSISRAFVYPLFPRPPYLVCSFLTFPPPACLPACSQPGMSVCLLSVLHYTESQLVSDGSIVRKSVYGQCPSASSHPDSSSFF